MGDHANYGGGRGLNPLFYTAADYLESLIWKRPFFEINRLSPGEKDFLVNLGEIASGNLDLVETGEKLGKSYNILDYEQMIIVALKLGLLSIKSKVEESERIVNAYKEGKKTLKRYRLDSHA